MSSETESSTGRRREGRREREPGGTVEFIQAGFMFPGLSAFL